MKKLTLSSVLLGALILTLFITGFHEVGIAGVALAFVPLSVNKIEFGKMDANKIIKTYSNSKSTNSLIEFIQDEERNANKDNAKYVDHYAGMSHKEMIQFRLKNADKPLAIESQAAALGVKFGKDSFEKFTSLQNGAGNILMPATLQLMIEMAMFRDESLVNQILAGSIGQDSLSVERLVLTDDVKYRRLSRVPIGANFPKLTFKTDAKEEKMSHIAGTLELPQRSLQAMAINVLDPTIQLITRQIAHDRVSQALDCIVLGDQNGGLITGASYLLPTGTTAQVSDADVIAFTLFGKPQYFQDGYILVGNAAYLAKWFEGWSDLSNYPGKIEAMGLQKPLAVIQWEEGVFASGKTADSWILKFNPKLAVTEYFQNGGVKIGVTGDDSQRDNYSISFANVMVKGLIDSAVALDVVH